jgi:hypothetical protein
MRAMSWDILVASGMTKVADWVKPRIRQRKRQECRYFAELAPVSSSLARERTIRRCLLAMPMKIGYSSNCLNLVQPVGVSTSR